MKINALAVFVRKIQNVNAVNALRLGNSRQMIPDKNSLIYRMLRLKTLKRSHRPEKKYDAVFERNGRQKVISFGAAGMSDYTKHKNATRKARYIKRHSGMGENWNKPDTAGALSRWILWNKPSFRDSVADYKRRFGF